MTAIRNGDILAFTRILTQYPGLVNKPIHWGLKQQNIAHPLHFLCDAVFEGYLSENSALAMAELLLNKGANINGPLLPGKDTPLIAACSLYTDQLGLLYLSHQPKLTHKGVHGGTCLHWAAYTGSDTMVGALIKTGMPLNDLDNEFRSPPIGWAIHAVQQKEPKRNQGQQINCIRLLAGAGAQFDGSVISSEAWPEITKALGLN
ncbi:MAG TPA: hypothetical protein VJ953_22725 [Saprospiraceae bacterium]|nr:hypothetical protein [Saprospiraceae bacterium]